MIMGNKTNTISKGLKETNLGRIPETWSLTSAEKFCVKVADGTHATPKPTEEGKPLVTSKHIKNGKVDLSSAYKISEEDFNEINKRSKVDQWDVLFSMLGTVGEIALINSVPDYAIKNVGLFKCGEESRAKWFYYFLRGKIGQDEIKRRMTGTTQSYVTLSDLRSFPVIIPSAEDELKKIVAILSSLDDKIELLREQNKTLEAIAKAIFKEWFVNYNFPGATGKMIASELGKIPEGWKVKTIDQATKKVTKGTTPTTIGGSFSDKGINFIKAESITANHNFDRNKFSYIDSETNKLLERSIIEEDDLLYSIAGTIGRFAVVPYYVLPANTNQAVAIIRADKKVVDPFYLQCALSLLSIKESLFGNIVEAVQANLSLTSIKDCKIILPDNYGLSLFINNIRVLFDKIVLNNSQIHTLSDIRDTLLPKLMKGEIRVRSFFH